MNSAGAFRVDFTNDSNVRSTLNSSATSALDGNWHDLLISYDGSQGTFEISLDNALLVSRTASGDTKSGGQWGLNFGSAWGATAFDGLIDDVRVENTALQIVSPPPPPAPLTTVSIDFTGPGTPPGLTLIGDAHISAGGTLQLDGAGDFAFLAASPTWSNPTYLSASIDFRFDDPNDLAYARPLYNDGIFGFDAKGNALNAMVMTETGKQNIYIGGIDFSDLQWHKVEMSIDADANHLVIMVDDETVVDCTNLDLVLPASIDSTNVGGIGWGRWLPGEIDNVSITAGTRHAYQSGPGSRQR